MIEFPIDVLWAIKSMFLRSVWNPNAFIYTIKNIIYSYYFLIFLIILCVIIVFILKVLFEILKRVKEKKKDKKNYIKFLYEFFINLKENWKNKEKLFVKNDIREVILKEKNIFKILKYPIIWSILVWIFKIPTSFMFWLLWKYYTDWQQITREHLPLEESWVLWVWATYSSLFFILAWCFIWLCFWNKMLRNIWILMYALWILFIVFWIFLYNWGISNGLSNFII